MLIMKLNNYHRNYSKMKNQEEKKMNKLYSVEKVWIRCYGMQLSVQSLCFNIDGLKYLIILD